MVAQQLDGGAALLCLGVVCDRTASRSAGPAPGPSASRIAPGGRPSVGVAAGELDQPGGAIDGAEAGEVAEVSTSATSGRDS